MRSDAIKKGIERAPRRAALYAVGCSEADLRVLEEAACPTCGSCAGMFTANSMNCLTESLGLAPAGNGTVPSVHTRRIHLAKDAGEIIIDLVRQQLCPRDIITAESIENAFLVAMTIGAASAGNWFLGRPGCRY